MNNPYSSPPPNSQPEPRSANQIVAVPAISLIVVAVISILAVLAGLGFDAVLILSGAVETMQAQNDGPISEQTQITVRIIWGVLLLFASIYVLYGAIKMLQLQSYQSAKSAAIVAVIPCISPCCFLGLPFGIWALIVLGRDHVRDAFR